jgi:hypothetical protein
MLLRDQAHLYSYGDQFPEIAGVDLEGAVRSIPDAPCYVIRITRDNCPFCRSDQPAYSALLDVARAEAVCEVVEISPMARQMQSLPREGVTQLELVHMGLGKALWPNFTPQTLVLDANRRLVWARTGVFDDRSLSDGLTTLRGLAGR